MIIKKEVESIEENNKKESTRSKRRIKTNFYNR